MSAEQAARKIIDELLSKAGWHVCDLKDTDIHAAQGVAIREFPLNDGYGYADYLLYVDGKAATTPPTDMPAIRIGPPRPIRRPASGRRVAGVSTNTTS